MDAIFNLIKLKDFKKIKNIIEKDEELDLNIIDEQNNYLIYYILINDQVDILKLILERNIRIDILDFDSRTILYIPIKFNFFDAFNLLLKYNDKLIGISIIDIRDNLGLTALHYCVILNNFIFFKLLIDSNANPLIRDNSGNNIYHFALKYKRTEVINYLIDKFDDLSFLSPNDESIIQYALITKNIKIVIKLLDIKKNINFNNQEKEFGLTILHQSIIYNYLQITEKLINLNTDINLQDFYGNTCLMYAITENLIDHIKYLINNNILNYNLTNIYGETGLHLIFKNYDYYVEYKNIIDKIIENTNLSIQNNKGDTCLLYICENNLFNDFKNILLNKELNIFIKNLNNKCPYDFIKNNLDNINIVIESFYNYLKINQDKLIIKWEIECINDINKCKKQIKKIIIEENRSIPKLNELELIFDSGIFVNTSYYTGAPIDVLFGLLYIYDSFKSINLNLIIDYPLTNNEELENYFKTLGVNFNYKLDFCNFEINWSYQKMIYPTYFDHEFKNKIKNSLYIIIPIGIETSIGSHANILFYDIKKNIIERFEPNGAYYPKNFNYNPQILDKILEDKFKSFNNNIKYIKPNEYLPVIGFQILENINNRNKHIGDPNGFCGVWCCWWVYQKLKNINIESNILVEKLIKEIKFKNLDFKTVIRNFSKNVFELRDNFLNKYDININDFINDNYDQNVLNNLEKDILTFI
jgi:ankyrin repeat protein